MNLRDLLERSLALRSRITAAELPALQALVHELERKPTPAELQDKHWQTVMHAHRTLSLAFDPRGDNPNA